MKLADTLRHIDYNTLNISDYSRYYIIKLLPVLDYYLDICDQALKLSPNNIHTLVDYGGGHGFLSLLAKQRGIKNVIYIDYNPQASQTIRTLSTLLGFGPDTILTGDQNTLFEWTTKHQCIPDALIGIDVIEHIYRLDSFFDTLHLLNPQMSMVFSTASTPYNPFVKRRLKHYMLMDEYGYGDQEGFLQLRRNYIATLHPEFSESDLDQWAKETRGLIYDDISAALQAPLTALHSPIPFPNTCNPTTGSWTERILPIKVYQNLVSPQNLSLIKGFYNSHRHNFKGFVAQILNLILRLPCTRWISPFIILKIK